MIHRYISRHIVRSRLKTGLAVALSAALIIAIGQFAYIIHSNRVQIEYLYDTVVVTATFIRADGLEGNPDVFHRMAEGIADNEFVIDSYFETTGRLFYAQKDALPAAVKEAYRPTDSGQTDMVTDYVGFVSDALFQNVFLGDEVYSLNDYVIPIENAEPTSFTAVESFFDLRTYISDEVNYTFADGVNTENIANINRPVLLGRDAMERYGIEYYQWVGTRGSEDAYTRFFTVVGSYEVAGESLVPSDGMIMLTRDYINLTYYLFDTATQLPVYSTAEYTIDTRHTREFDEFSFKYLQNNQDYAKNVLFVLGDDEVRGVIRPLEQNTYFLDVLYPILFAIMAAIAAALPGLIVVQSSKEASIMRILGTSKTRSRILLTLEQLALSAAGLLIGIMFLLIYNGSNITAIFTQILTETAVCLTSAVGGAAICAVAVTRRNVLELLQTRE